MNETYPLLNQATHDNSGLLWFLHAPFWQQMFFVTMAAGIITFVHIMGWIDWRKIWKEIKIWVSWVKMVELPNQKKERDKFFNMFKNKFVNYLHIKYDDRQNYNEEIEIGENEK
jgi:hypothetical protein